MEMQTFFKGIVDGDPQPIVICDLNHQIVYMNPAAMKRYEKSGGANMIGQSIFSCHNPHSQSLIKENVDLMKSDCSINRIYESHNARNGLNEDLYAMAIRDESGELIGYYERHEDKNIH